MATFSSHANIQIKPSSFIRKRILSQPYNLKQKQQKFFMDFCIHGNIKRTQFLCLGHWKNFEKIFLLFTYF